MPVSIQLPAGAACRGCGYRLCGLTAQRCPECGRGFDPSDPATVRLPGDRSASLPLIATAAFVGWLLASLVTLPLLVAATGATNDRTGRLPVVAVGSAWVGSLVRRPVRGIPGELSPRGRRRAWLVLFALALLAGGAASAVDRSCPHGTIWGAFRLGLARSDTGEPCANYMPTLWAVHVAGPWYLWWG